MRLKLVPSDSDILRQKMDKTDNYDSMELRRWIQAMKDLAQLKGGIGLAAPQVGLNERIIIVKVGRSFKAYINPTWKKIGNEKEVLSEGCLSFPNTWVEVKRFRKIKCKAYDQKGNLFEDELEGIEARAFQHEHDHLEGKCLVGKKWVKN